MNPTRKKLFIYIGLFLVVIVGGIYIFTSEQNQSQAPAAMEMGHVDNMGSMGNMSMGDTSNKGIPVTHFTAPKTNAPTKTFTLIAESKKINLGNGITTDALTFNGTVPGPELRVTQGDRVVVHLINKLNTGVTIHWHGVDVPGAEDGIAGVTQDAVKPGQTFTYTFIANQPGTYWYHSHQDSFNQVGKGLFGAFVVDPKKPAVKYDKDYTLTLHDWNIPGNNVFTVNGTSSGVHLAAKPGEQVRLRLINTGNATHLLTLTGAKFSVIALDGHDISGPSPIEKTLLPVGAAGRCDISFKMPANGVVKLVDADVSDNENKMISATIGNGQPVSDNSNPKEYPRFDFTTYGVHQRGIYSLSTSFTKTYDLKLGEGMTINGKLAPNIPPIEVKQGDSVKITLENNSSLIHPMHLHGHTFQVLSKNGKPLSGSPIYLDTLNMMPKDSYVIAFQANNPGIWMFHCHDLSHAAVGMDVMVYYQGISTPYKVGNNSGNNPE
ncbi:multicopper oxidase family protein [Aneurinibacillus sp. Ricciae_BoGa-3]|uniref:multicopper oxidase family protein n=1 Tax=Aneurinibacillus sp. Ricciae_BoGa-3 TaxID=3022697 RepID=UPI00234067EE|nr:multicopper oxidase family protein [Aneurinibacillus sp. Ricciae_BoGa-3]WCK53182.1 multicopper oxidase family protein [Aneurinibacillus sp. Ricciae_BoGa-3]